MSTWTVISDSRVDADSPVTESLITDLRENIEYNHEHAIRAGTHAVGVRRAMATGQETLNEGSPTGNYTWSGTVTFSSEADHGDPNFFSAPRIFLTIEEDTTSAQVWSAELITVSPYVDALSVDENGFTYKVFFTSVNTGSALKARLWWMAMGDPVSGE